MKYDYDCGPTSIALLLSAYGVNEYKPRELIKIFKTTKNGTDWRRINKFLKELKTFNVEDYMSVSRARKYLNNKIPLFICWDVEGKYSHYSVLLKMDELNAIILDPEDRKRFTSHELSEFKKYWRPYRYWFMRLIPKMKSKSVRSFTGAGATGITEEPAKGQLNISKVEEWIKRAKIK